MITLRSIISGSSTYLLFIAIRYLPIGLHSILFNFGPFFTLILATLILKEIIPRIEIINMVVSFVGVILVIYNSKSTASNDWGEENE